MKYEAVIGLEVHVELSTVSKLFCTCPAKFGTEQNKNVCPACCGMPGMLPVTNKKVVELGMKAGMMLNCDINRVTTFDKKNYYYPDLPSAYQTTQWFAPISVNGYVDIETSSGPKSIRIEQIHMEEDAGKLVHDDWTDTTLVDFNRTSVPLIEIVSEPDLSSAEEVVAYLKRLRDLLRFAKVSNCRWEQGSMRCDVNISLREAGTDGLGVRSEIKNMNSLSAITRAIDYEIARHTDALARGTEELVQETRKWDDVKDRSYAMRTKETAGDYRYFPDPNVMPIVIDDDWYSTVNASLPMLPEEKRAAYIELGLSEKDAEQLTESIAFCDVFDAAFEVCGQAKEVSNWLISDCMAVLNKKQMTIDELAIDGTALGQIIKLISEDKIARSNGKKILDSLFEGEIISDVEEYAKSKGMIISGDTGEIDAVIAAAIAANPKAVEDYKAGNEKAINAIFGQCMKELKGNCNPKTLREMLMKAL
ncbi:MAG: Asp-tRNA(Asn)/Glu-tRNA(Gln) amidotransferase subunit GatB [Lentihominibacter sp.]|jgi:aspartyl-tRNA(Asn)/glutamyl-tRNA(Gln) amidotransferase subunit B